MAAPSEKRKIDTEVSEAVHQLPLTRLSQAPERLPSSHSNAKFDDIDYEDASPPRTSFPPKSLPIGSAKQPPVRIESIPKEEAKTLPTVPDRISVPEPIRKRSEEFTPAVVFSPTSSQRRSIADLKPPHLFSTSGSCMMEVDEREMEKVQRPVSVSRPPSIFEEVPIPAQQLRPREVGHVVPPPIIEVINPRIIPGGWVSRSYTLYTIITTFSRENTAEVDRRFSDVDWMHSQLCIQYKGVSIPPLPDKHVFGNFSPSFIEERRAQMEKYLNMVVANEILRRSEVVTVLLTSPLDKLDEEKVRAEKATESKGYSGMEDVMDHLVAKIHSKINTTLISSFTQPSEEILKLELTLSHLHPQTTSFSSAFSAWVKSERSLLDMHNAVVLPQHCTFNHTMEEFMQLETKALRTMEKQAMDCREEVMRIEGLNNAIYAYRGTAEAIGQQEALIQRKEGKLRALQIQEQRSRYQMEIDSASEELKGLKEQLKKIACNISKDNQRFKEQREEHLRTTLLAVAETQQKRWEKNWEFWRGKTL